MASRFLRPGMAMICVIGLSMLLGLSACSKSESNENNNTEAQEALSAELVAQGEELYLTLGCAQCHTRDGKRLLAPTFKGLYGKEETLEDGSKVIVDDAYIRESILEPNAKVVAGYQPMHPPMSWELDEQKIAAIIAFIKSLR